ncbi:hypothetical protein EV190_12763 [Actinorugispora endophytica]|uniref:Uncharacterized protein n=1 Tax=Actinorugispora endophytica TaxID=1605990 RepID=A0A4R6UKX5_9ACTN|nr:hypothetical protein EV190_12763 [Actinorugispora endophytica]
MAVWPNGESEEFRDWADEWSRTNRGNEKGE